MNKILLFNLVGLLFLAQSCKEKDLGIPETKSGLHFFINDGGEEVITSMIASDGTVLYAGSSNDDAFLFAVNAQGQKLWHTKAGSVDGKERFNGIKETKDGNFVAVGYTNSVEYGASAGTFGGYAVKFNKNGSVIWEQTYAANRYLALNDIIETRSGDLMAVGVYQPASASSIIIKLSSDGEMLWNAYYEIGFWHDMIKSIVEISDGEYLIAGICSQANPSNQVHKFIPYTMIIHDKPNGPVKSNEQIYFGYLRELNVDGERLKMKLIKTDNGYSLAYTRDEIGYPSFIQLINFNSGFNIVSDKKIYGEGLAMFNNMTFVDGNILITGTSFKSTSGSLLSASKLMNMMLDEHVKTLWESYEGGETHFQGALSAKANGTSFQVGGYSLDPVLGSTKFVYYNLDAQGNVIYE